MTVQAGWGPPGIDTAKANVARVYDYWLGDSHSFRADQDAEWRPDPPEDVPEDPWNYWALAGAGVKRTFAPVTRSEYGR
jgi:hypothetical protein